MAPEPRTGVYPGTFDPITLGHLDIIQRAARLVDRLVVAVSVNAGKSPLFTSGDREAMVRADIESLAPDAARRIEVLTFDELLVTFVQRQGGGVIIRGLRAVSDFEYEIQMASVNSRLAPDIETIFLSAAESHQFISSRFVKEVGRLGGDLRQFVTTSTAERMAARLRS